MIKTTYGPVGLIAALFRRAIRDTRLSDPILSTEAESFLRCPGVEQFLTAIGIKPDYFYELLEQEI